jgi:hypothetical protein
VFVSGEGVNVFQEPWNFDVIKKILPEYLNIASNSEVINSGVIGGKRKSLITLYEKMYDLCENSLNDHNIKDQAALIVLLSKEEIENVKVFNLDEGWAVHCAVAGPTQFFEIWGFKQNLKYGIPKMINGFVCTSNGLKYDIVHQFNRIPEWEKIIKNQLI